MESRQGPRWRFDLELLFGSISKPHSVRAFSSLLSYHHSQLWSTQRQARQCPRLRACCLRSVLGQQQRWSAFMLLLTLARSGSSLCQYVSALTLSDLSITTWTNVYPRIGQLASLCKTSCRWLKSSAQRFNRGDRSFRIRQDFFGCVHPNDCPPPSRSGAPSSRSTACETRRKRLKCSCHLTSHPL